MNYVKQEDLNAAFFYKSANMRKRKNKNLRLESQGKIIDDEESIRGIFQEHFKNLFGSKVVQCWLCYFLVRQIWWMARLDKLAKISKHSLRRKLKRDLGSGPCWLPCFLLLVSFGILSEQISSD